MLPDCNTVDTNNKPLKPFLRRKSVGISNSKKPAKIAEKYSKIINDTSTPKILGIKRSSTPTSKNDRKFKRLKIAHLNEPVNNEIDPIDNRPKSKINWILNRYICLEIIVVGFEICAGLYVMSITSIPPECMLF